MVIVVSETNSSLETYKVKYKVQQPQQQHARPTEGDGDHLLISPRGDQGYVSEGQYGTLPTGNTFGQFH